ncbi:hypothetical protein CCMA1212_009718, partial [Trichoderma ghanense]
LRICQVARRPCLGAGGILPYEPQANRGIIKHGHPVKARQLRRERCVRLLILPIQITATDDEELGNSMNNMGHSAGIHTFGVHADMLSTPLCHAIAQLGNLDDARVNPFLNQSMNLQV